MSDDAGSSRRGVPGVPAAPSWLRRATASAGVIDAAPSQRLYAGRVGWAAQRIGRAAHLLARYASGVRADVSADLLLARRPTEVDAGESDVASAPGALTATADHASTPAGPRPWADALDGLASSAPPVQGADGKLMAHLQRRAAAPGVVDIQALPSRERAGVAVSSGAGLHERIAARARAELPGAATAIAAGTRAPVMADDVRRVGRAVVVGEDDSGAGSGPASSHEHAAAHPGTTASVPVARARIERQESNAGPRALRLARAEGVAPAATASDSGSAATAPSREAGQFGPDGQPGSVAMPLDQTRIHADTPSQSGSTILRVAAAASPRQARDTQASASAALPPIFPPPMRDRTAAASAGGDTSIHAPPARSRDREASTSAASAGGAARAQAVVQGDTATAAVPGSRPLALRVGAAASPVSPAVGAMPTSAAAPPLARKAIEEHGATQASLTPADASLARAVRPTTAPWPSEANEAPQSVAGAGVGAPLPSPMALARQASRAVLSDSAPGEDGAAGMTALPTAPPAAWVAAASPSIGDAHSQRGRPLTLARALDDRAGQATSPRAAYAAAAAASDAPLGMDRAVTQAAQPPRPGNVAVPRAAEARAAGASAAPALIWREAEEGSGSLLPHRRAETGRELTLLRSGSEGPSAGPAAAVPSAVAPVPSVIGPSGETTGTAQASVTSPDLHDLAEQVMRMIARRLQVERERRGGGTWI